MSSPKNIYVVGAQGTGKTTIVNGLKRHYEPELECSDPETPKYVPEIARRLLEELQISGDDIKISPEAYLQFQKALLQGQYKAEAALSSFHNGLSWYISDRSGLDPIAYTQLYVSKEAADILLASKSWKSLETKMRDGLVVLCESGCSWPMEDGLRSVPEDLTEWTRIHRGFEQLLKARGIQYIIVPAAMSELEDRVALVRRAHASK